MLMLGWPALFAQVPEAGRWQDFAFSAEEVRTSSEWQYRERLSILEAHGELDKDEALLQRVRRVGATLVRGAPQLRPDCATWSWEFHVSSSEEDQAWSLAGGKLLVGARWAAELQLDDGELAALLAHEMAHVLADHHREAVSQALAISPGRSQRSLDALMRDVDSDLSTQIALGALSRMQESEADQVGFVLAVRSGWPASAIVSFYGKLAEHDQPGVFSWSHPSAASRLSVVRALAILYAE
jgi:predicted Zn-dependent protease